MSGRIPCLDRLGQRGVEMPLRARLVPTRARFCFFVHNCIIKRQLRCYRRPFTRDGEVPLLLAGVRSDGCACAWATSPAVSRDRPVQENVHHQGDVFHADTAVLAEVGRTGGDHETGVSRREDLFNERGLPTGESINHASKVQRIWGIDSRRKNRSGIRGPTGECPED